MKKIPFQTVNLNFVGDKFLGDKYIISNKGISIKSNTFNCVNDNRCVVYSKNGDIEITSSNVSMKGLIYAPNGTVNITSSNFQIEGKIIAKNIICRGSRFNIKRFNKINSLVDLDENLNLNDSDNDGVLDGDEKFNQKIKDKKTGTKVVITSKGDVTKNINITKIDKKSMISL